MVDHYEIVKTLTTEMLPKQDRLRCVNDLRIPRHADRRSD